MASACGLAPVPASAGTSANTEQITMTPASKDAALLPKPMVIEFMTISPLLRV